MNSLLLSVFKLSRANTQPENICDTIFEKTKGVYAEAIVQRVLWKRCCEKWCCLHNSQEGICIKIAFFDKVKLCRSAAFLLIFNSCFQRSPGQKPLRLSPIYTRFIWKRYLLLPKSRSSFRRCPVTEGLQFIKKRLQQCEIFKNTYLEKHMWTAASENL